MPKGKAADEAKRRLRLRYPFYAISAVAVDMA
jgi:hypothetical protein